VCAAAGLDPYQARRLLREESSHFAPPQLPSQYRSSGLVGSVHLKNLLGNIQSNGRYLHHGSSSS
jgi:hypothetical protein